MIHLTFDESFKLAKQFLATNGDLFKPTEEGKKVQDGEQYNFAVLTLAELIRSYYHRGVADTADKIQHITDQLADIGIYQNFPDESPYRHKLK